MRAVRQVLGGFLLALASGAIILGGFSLALAEGNLRAFTLGPASPTLPSLAPFTDLTPPPTPSPTLTPTLPPPPTSCLPPAGWIPITVQPGDTLESLGLKYHTTAETLAQANCLLTVNLLPGAILYVPNVPTPCPTPCLPPAGWVLYTIQPGDTLYHLAQLLGITVADLQAANCMGNSTFIRAGDRLYVPYLPPTHTPTSTEPAPPSDTPSPTSTTPVSPTPSATPTPTGSSTPTETPLPTNTPT